MLEAHATRPAGAANAPAVSDCPTEVVSHVAVNAEYRHLVLRAGAPATLAEPGQFFHLLCPANGEDKPYLRRPMSTYRADPATGTVEFLYKVTGLGTRALTALASGDELNILGPLGVGFRLDPAWRTIVVLGRGVGLATLAPLAEAAHALGIAVTAILSARRADLVMSAERFAAIGAQVVPVLDSDGSSEPARVAALLDGLAEAGRADAVFTCGSNRLFRLAKDVAARRGIAGQVALEQQMACGLGMCFCCVRKFEVDGRLVDRRVCWDGPVFDLKEATSW
ncbi:dihydroorotate dehydrogenase electron transfer subunit [Chelatococcus sp. SYSU_G07232]|uniref:Dihydroorotate dehydrogenase electron transfer subunit n=1 Tax=Chelatococcus albus TaxID=3047466 RepID=A0ABT7AL50_9HYPH|nr:dihydroorotate dehydrogenase electron transfer subunit [Chelatococcus sp. SYSU_G07232]MDJ1160100.1 dihydroorotate dehydrogenase electron transfer subunit [Chelatococcus sp. SYSU_G07232]